MSGLDIFAVIVLIVLLAAIVVVFVVLAMLPGKIAKSRNHPQADAINAGGWLGALFGGILWPIILIWAFTVPRGALELQERKELEDLRKRAAEADQQAASSEAPLK